MSYGDASPKLLPSLTSHDKPTNEEKLSKVLDIYEKRLEEARFLASDEFYLANLSHLPNTQYLVSDSNKGNSFTSRENVGRWWDEISSRDSWKKVVDLQKGEI
ncbi:glutathione s-transferase f11 [Quercus suber]|uniref:glutathione transferase n=1 Tax=Quercus suber TaxID=58331 RepID=A0AAW0J2P8_QUESU